MKNTVLSLVFLSLLWLSSCNGTMKTDDLSNAGQPKQAYTTNNTLRDDAEGGSITDVSGNEGSVIYLTKAMFLEKVYDFELNPQKWTFKGDKPCIIDFYADWCRPCKMVAPIMTEMAEKYKGKITVYKVNTDKERELAQFFSIRSIPTVFFCPLNGDPNSTQGALDKANYEKIINEVLLKN